jgi:hypothetical protein
MRALKFALFLSCALPASSQTPSSRPEFIAGKHYSLKHWDAVIEWQLGSDVKRLTGFELANLVDTLGSCETIYFDALNREKPDKITIDTALALDQATYEYIHRLESAISRLDPTARQKIIDALLLDHYSSIKTDDLPLVTLDPSLHLPK